MPSLFLFDLPLPAYPPSEYNLNDCEVSALSRESAFDTGIDQRDVFGGESRCVICGDPDRLEHCHIIPRSETITVKWRSLLARHWLPSVAKASPTHDARNGLLMCANHHRSFDTYKFFIRYIPEAGRHIEHTHDTQLNPPQIHKFIFVNQSGSRYDQIYHGKAIGLDASDRYVPFASIFVIHEMRVRGFWPFSDQQLELPEEIAWQDWITSDLLQSTTGGGSPFFHREAQPGGQAPSPILPLNMSTGMSTGTAGGPSSGKKILALNNDVIAEILAATWAMPSWKAYQVEGTDWSGTAEENIQKYAKIMGTGT